MNINEIIKIAKIKNVNDEIRKFRIKRKLLSSPNPTKIINSLSVYDLENLDKEILKSKVDGYKNLYDCILKNRDESIYPKIEDRKDIELALTWLENKKRFGLFDITDELLLSKLSNDQTVLDFAIENNCFKSSHIIIKSKDVALELIKRNRLDILAYADIEVLKLKVDGVPLIELLLDNNIYPKIKGVKFNNSNKDTNTLLKMSGIQSIEENEDSLIKTIDEIMNKKIEQSYEKDILFETIDGDKKIIDYLLERNLDIKFKLIPDIDKSNWKELGLKCVLYGKRNTITQTNEEFYLQKLKTSDGKNHRLLDFFSTADNFDILGDINDFDLAIKMALNENNYATLILNCPNELLTKLIDNKFSIIEYIITKFYSQENDNLKALLIVLNKLNKFDDKMAMIFAKYRIYCQPMDASREFGIDKDNSIETYLYGESTLQTQKKYKNLVDNFVSLYSDGNSSKDVIDSVIILFNRTVLIDSVEAVRDLQALIEYKIKNNNFNLLLNNSKGNSFSRDYISIQNKFDFSALAHEWGHLIHMCYYYEYTPSQIYNLIPNLYNYYVTNKEESNKLFDEIDKEASSLFDEENIYFEFLKFICYKKGSFDTYIDEIRNEYISFCGSEDLVLDALKANNLSKEVTTALVDAMYSDSKNKYLEENYISKYIKERVNAEFLKFKKVKYKRDNAEFLCYENFIDAYYGGALGEIRKTRTTKAPTCTHDANYFKNYGFQFSEMFANYVELKKSPNGYKYIKKLREKTSNELIEAIEDYYKNIEKGKSKYKFKI